MNRPPLLNRVALVDTCFWYAMFDERDQYYQDAQPKIGTLLTLKYLLPWPVLYETLGTRWARHQHYLRKFHRLLKRPNAQLLDDTRYRMQALELTLASADRRGRPLSLVDNVLRLIIEDTNVKVNCVFTFNRGDFTDVCTRRQIELI